MAVGSKQEHKAHTEDTILLKQISILHLAITRDSDIGIYTHSAHRDWLNQSDSQIVPHAFFSLF